MSNPQYYTVGWICAISTEYVAAQVFLDEKHDGPAHVSAHDNNDYTLGRVGKHNVVIAVAPDGEYGTQSAATVARDMMHSFTNVRIGLMVGIAGGVPSPKHDIRLGDVVVSAPRDGKGGVFQYDFGKQRQEQHFQATGFLNQPPPLLRTAVAGLRAQYKIDGHRLKEDINNALENKPRLREEFQWPGADADRLHLSEVTHPLNDERDCSEACGLALSKFVSRSPRKENEDNPAIHYGLIASANRVMKDALVRDEAAELGVLCFEMEAAGLMNHFPCLVIRGICDYSDSHKNKEWQGHAAMAAAAYAKDLLCRIAPSRIEVERKIIDALSDTLHDVHQAVDKLVQGKYNQEYDYILDWLTPADYTTMQNDYIKRWQLGTGQWFLSSAEYGAWLETSNRTLFCPGIPGAGKTIIATIVVNDLLMRYHDKLDVGIAYLYCNFQQVDQQSAEDLLASLLKQLSRSKPSLRNIVQNLYDRHATRRTRPSLSEISKALHSMVAAYSRTFIVVDALDECRASVGRRDSFLSELLGVEISGANVLVTSRQIPDITERFKNKLNLEIRATCDDVGIFLDGRMSWLPRFVNSNQQLQEEIKTHIVQTVNGMFLLAQLRLESLVGKRSARAIQQVLRLPQNQPNHTFTDSEVYDMTYQDAMARIHQQNADQKKLALEVLSWITCSKRPLTTSELRHALAVEPGDFQLHKDSLPAIEDMVSVCTGLVTVDEESDIIRLVHYTTQEFLERTQHQWFPNAESHIATICVTYLSFDVFGGGICKTDIELEERLRSNQFYDYAAHNWGHHARGASITCREVIEFFDKKAHVDASCQALMAVKSYKRYSLRFPRQMTGLHLAAYFGAKEVVSSLLHREFELDVKDASGQTPLSWASERGYDTIVRLLLATNRVEPDSKDDYGRTPLSWAAERGNETVVRLLLATGQVDPESKDTEHGRTPLWYAVGNEAVLSLLLGTGQIDLYSKDNYGQTLLSWISSSGHPAGAKLPLETGKFGAGSGDDTAQIQPMHTTNERSVFPPAPLAAPSRLGHSADERYSFQYSNCTGRRKALLIGINYFGQRGQLRGCINAVKNMSAYLNQDFGYAREDMVILTDDQHNLQSQPTRANITRAMHWLVKDARANDSLFFHYCGHGGQTPELGGNEDDGYDEVIYPVDYLRHGHIVDDEMHRILVKSLPAVVRLTAIFDSCHSGSALDLPYIYSTQGVLKEPHLAKEADQGLLSIVSSYARGYITGMASTTMGLFKKVETGNSTYERNTQTKTSPADVIMWSGSKDEQTSQEDIKDQAIGAISRAFITVLKKNPHQSYVQLLNSIRDELATKYTQKPQLSCSHPLNTDLLYMM